MYKEEIVEMIKSISIAILAIRNIGEYPENLNRIDKLETRLDDLCKSLMMEMSY